MKSSRSVIQARHNEITKLLRGNGSLSVNDLAARLSVTPATIRRDLSQLEQTGVVTRSFGTASYAVPSNMREIEPTNVEDDKELLRRKIAKAAAEIVEDGDVLFLNSSATASLILEYLNEKSVTILTNNCRIINRNKAKHVQLLLVGGEVYGKKQSLIGQFALDTISRVVASKAILGVSGISAQGGLTSVILPETQINLQMLNQCKGPRIVVADGSKVGVTENYYSGNLRDVTHLITDSSADDKSLQEIRDAGVVVITV